MLKKSAKSIVYVFISINAQTQIIKVKPNVFVNEREKRMAIFSQENNKKIFLFLWLINVYFINGLTKDIISPLD